jgi:putative two-component system response regulator
MERRLDAPGLEQSRILIVDDEETNVLLLERMLGLAGYTNVTSTCDSAQVASLCVEDSPDLLLLDLHMPEPDGFEVMRRLKPLIDVRWFPILVLTADITVEAKREALASGAKDFVTKPFDREEVLLRIRNLLETRLLQLELEKQNLMLEQRVYERTEDLNEARIEALERLAVAAEYRDDATGEHTRRVGRTSALLAELLGLPQEQCELIRLAAPLHDVGKIGIPDSVLLKEGQLTPEEYELMTSHVNIGRFILSGSRSPLLQMAEEIAFTHHEWWDGSGYLSGLRGEEIPIAGRIVAIADVFDALTHERPYKHAWPVDEALAEIASLRGRQFDPLAVDAFETMDHRALLGPVVARPAGRALALVGVQ